MYIKRLTIENFRQFKDKEVIEFSNEKEANITLILGDNTSGKTTILQSFLWCLYGEQKITFKSKHQLYNEENAREMKNGEYKDIKVILEIEHLNTAYIVERTQECFKSNDNVRLLTNSNPRVFYRNEKGEMEEVEAIDAQNVINDILPADLSEYFFYDTERFGNITDKQDVTESVKGLLGLKILENALTRHLGLRTQSQTVVGRLYNELNHEGNEDIEKLKQKIDSLQKSIENDKEIIELNKKNKSEYETALEANEKTLRTLAVTMRLQEEIDEKRTELESVKRDSENSKLDFLKEFKRGTLDFFIKPLLNETHVLIDNTEIKEEFIRGMDADAIDDIISRGTCVCGTKIRRESIQYEELQKALQIIPPHSIGVLVNTHQTLVSNIINKENYFKDSLVTRHKTIEKHNTKIDQLDHFIETKQEDIKGIENAKGIQDKIESYRKKINKLENDIRDKEYNIRYSNEQIDKLNNEISSYLQINEHNEEILTLLKYAEAVTDWFQEDYDRQHSEIRQELEEKVNYYFQEIYHGDRVVKIDETYRVTLHDKDNHYLVTDESAGLETVKNFAFIAGLVELAKKKLEENNKRMERESVEEDYPLVLDAPFSNVDEEHVVNISSVLPKVTGQLILIVMEKDWKYAAKELTYRVGKKYTLNKHTELYTTIKKG